MIEKVLGDVATFIRGVTFDKSKQEIGPSKNNIPLLRAGNITDKLDTVTDLIYVSYELVSKEKILIPNDIVICLSSGSKVSA